MEEGGGGELVRRSTDLDLKRARTVDFCISADRKSIRDINVGGIIRTSRLSTGFLFFLEV